MDLVPLAGAASYARATLKLKPKEAKIPIDHMIQVCSK